MQSVGAISIKIQLFEENKHFSVSYKTQTLYDTFRYEEQKDEKYVT